MRFMYRVQQFKSGLPWRLSGGWARLLLHEHVQLKLGVHQGQEGGQYLIDGAGHQNEDYGLDHRPCPHCQAPLEDVRHAVYDCPLYAGLREEYAELFHSPGHALPSLAAFLGQARQGRLARFADRCHEEHAAALAQ